MSPTFIRKEPKNQFPNSSAIRVQTYELGSTNQSYIWLGSEDFEEKRSGWKSFCWNGAARVFLFFFFRRNGVEIVSVDWQYLSPLGRAAPRQQPLHQGSSVV